WFALFVANNDYIRLHVALNGFTYVHHTDYLALTRIVVFRRNVLSRFFSHSAQRPSFVTLSEPLLYSGS
ncbi:hypothetical protein AB6C98_02985, partial [Vibrio splendidus]